MITWTKVLGDGILTINGQPNSLSNIQVNQVLDYVTLCDKNLEPLTQMSLLQWINSTFGLSMTWPWLRSFISSQKTLFLVDSEHLEEVRTKLTEQQLKENSDILIAKLQIAHPELVVNMDETSLDNKQETDKLKVVSQHDCPRQYQLMRGDSHITFVPTVGVTGWTLPVLVILKSLTVVSDLAIRYGFPKSKWTI